MLLGINIKVLKYTTIVGRKMTVATSLRHFSDPTSEDKFSVLGSGWQQVSQEGED